MISPQGQNESCLRDLADRVDHHAAPPRRPTSALLAAAVLAAVMITCVGFGGALQSASAHCHGIKTRVCLAIVFDDLTGRAKPIPPSD